VRWPTLRGRERRIGEAARITLFAGVPFGSTYAVIQLTAIRAMNGDHAREVPDALENDRSRGAKLSCSGIRGAGEATL